MNEDTVRRHVRSGAHTLDALAAACDAGSDCQGCKEKLLELIREETAPSNEAKQGGGAAGRGSA